MILALLACTDTPVGLIRGDAPLWDTAALPVFRIRFDEEDWRQALWDNVDVEDDCADRPYVAVEVTFENPLTGEREDYADVGARWRGHASLRAAAAGEGELPGLKLSFNEFVEDRRFHDTAKINLLGTEGDFTWMREHLAFDMARSLGIEAPRAAYALAYVNDEFFGTFPYSEESDDRAFVEAHFPDRAYSLYEAKGYCGDDFAMLEDRGPDPADYVTIYEPKAGTDDEDTLDDLIPFLQCASVSDDEAFRACLPEHLDVENFLSLIALDHVAPEIDGLVGRAHNFMLFYDRADGRFQVYPWDKDQSFSAEHLTGDTTPFDFDFKTDDEFKPTLVDRMQRVHRAEYCERLEAALPFVEPEAFDARVQELALFLWYPLKADPRVDHVDWKFGVQQMMDNNAAWYERLSEQIADGCG